MPKIVEFKNLSKKEIISAIKSGNLFIFPTDTTYGIGCNALKQESIQLVKKIYSVNENLVSVIAPNKRWINDNFEIINKKFIDKLPGPYTYILKAKKKTVSRSIAPGKDYLPVRMPDHGFIELIKKAGVPFLMINLNTAGKKEIREINQIPKRVLNGVDFVIDYGYLHKFPSTLIDLTSEIPKLVKR